MKCKFDPLSPVELHRLWGVGACLQLKAAALLVTSDVPDDESSVFQGMVEIYKILNLQII